MKNKYVSRLVTNVEQLKSSWGIELQTIGGKTLDATTAKVESLLRSATRAWNSCNVMESLGLTDALRHTSRLPSIHKKLTCGVVLVQVHARLLHARLVAMIPVRYIAVRKIIATNLPLGWSAVPCYLYFQYLMFWWGKCLKKTCDFCTIMSFVEGLYLFLRITLRICCTAVHVLHEHSGQTSGMRKGINCDRLHANFPRKISKENMRKTPWLTFLRSCL